MTESFPRGKDIPSQTVQFWVAHKDRYLRQLLIKDIEEITGRKLVVYFTDCDNTRADIDTSDDVRIQELLSECHGEAFDLLLETNGGFTDATEKICSMLRLCSDYRVIVPRRAKSNGTVIALSGTEIVMGFESELGPIDPFINGIPVEFILNAPIGSMTALDIQFAETARKQTRKLAKDMLSTGMMREFSEQLINETIDRIATRDHYHSHGSVISATEAQNLNLKVNFMTPDSDLWKRIWLLRSMYQFDCAHLGYSKIFETARISSFVKPATS